MTLSLIHYHMDISSVFPYLCANSHSNSEKPDLLYLPHIYLPEGKVGEGDRRE